MAKIWVTGATGFIGKRLVLSLLNEGHEVWALNRVRGTTLFAEPHEGLHIVYGDMRSATSLEELHEELPHDLDVAYYLMHSMGHFDENLIEAEKQVAQQFIGTVKKTNIKQIIYLGGIIRGSKLSHHLESRLMVEKILRESGIPLTVLRASLIVGEGSASFEIIRDLVEKLPVMVAPRWVNSLCQPIGVQDVMFYLKGVALNPDCFDRTFEIGGPEVLTFKQVLMQYAEVRKLKRYIITVPVLTPRLSSYWLLLVTSVRFSLAYYLVESMKSDTFVEDHSIDKILPHKCLAFKQSIEFSLNRIAKNEVASTWMDAWDPTSQGVVEDHIEVPRYGVLVDEKTALIKTSPDKVLSRIWSLGGQEGWYSLDWAWKLRGLVDKLVGGVGLNRGRRSPTELQPGDSVDFWRVLKADKADRHLILLAEMKLPGEAWLEFKINDTPAGPQLEQRATFRPKGLLGRFYWYMLLPFHNLLFGRMLKQLIKD